MLWFMVPIINSHSPACGRPFRIVESGGNFRIIHHCVLFEIQCIDGIDQGFLLRLHALGGRDMNRIPAGIGALPENYRQEP